jgi:hypothetical protein
VALQGLLGHWKWEVKVHLHELRNCVAFRVTRSGEFSPIRSLFTLGSFFKNTEVAPNKIVLLF